MTMRSISSTRHRVCRPVVELRRLRRRVPGDLLSVLEGPPVREVRRGPRRSERVAARQGAQPRRGRPPPPRSRRASRLRLLELGRLDVLVPVASAARWWVGTSCLFPPFSWSRSTPGSPVGNWLVAQSRSVGGTHPPSPRTGPWPPSSSPAGNRSVAEVGYGLPVGIRFREDIEVRLPERGVPGAGRGPSGGAPAAL